MAHINLRDDEADGSERSDLSIICDSSLNSLVRMRPLVCQLYNNGQCTRGAECPLLHELPSQNIYTLPFSLDDQDDPAVAEIIAKASDISFQLPEPDRDSSNQQGTVSLSQQQMDLQRMGALMSIRRLVFSGTSESNGASSSYQIPPHQPYPYAYNYKPTYW